MDIVTIGDATLYHGDCLEILPTLDKVDAIVTDPPYPDKHVPQYGFSNELMGAICCDRFMVFWSSRAEFPLAHSSVHIWDKKTGVQSQYERIFEAGGGAAYKVFRHYLINSTVAASFTGDIYTGHPSQKPERLMVDVVAHISKNKHETILDPFMGSGTTGVACANLGRKFIGIEIERKYFDIAVERITAAYAQQRLFP